MSYSYYLVCLDCGKSIHLGKSISVTYTNNYAANYGFAMLGNNTADGWEADTESASKLQQFFAIHRGHALSVLPETVQRKAPTVEFVFPVDNDTKDPLYNCKDFFEHPIDPPDAETDWTKVSDDILQKLTKSTKDL